jgi:hypothetical protein
LIGLFITRRRLYACCNVFAACPRTNAIPGNPADEAEILAQPYPHTGFILLFRRMLQLPISSGDQARDKAARSQRRQPKSKSKSVSPKSPETTLVCRQCRDPCRIYGGTKETLIRVEISFHLTMVSKRSHVRLTQETASPKPCSCADATIAHSLHLQHPRQRIMSSARHDGRACRQRRVMQISLQHCAAPGTACDIKKYLENPGPSFDPISLLSFTEENPNSSPVPLANAKYV